MPLWLDGNKFYSFKVSFLSEMIGTKILSKPRPKIAKSPHPVDALVVRRSKTSLLKLPIAFHDHLPTSIAGHASPQVKLLIG